MNGLAICSGVGGIELGLRLTDPEYKTVCYIEREAYPVAVTIKKMEEGLLDEAPIWDDLRTFNGKPWCGKVDIITAGFPCQPWSAAGKREGTEDERWLWPDIFKIICDIRPRTIFLENVPGLLNGGVEIILRDLAKIGYDAIWNVFSAIGVGANHLRKRIFILAYPQGIGLSESRDVYKQSGRTSVSGASKNMPRGGTPEHTRASEKGEDVANPQGEGSGRLQNEGQKERSHNSDELSGECCGIRGKKDVANAESRNSGEQTKQEGREDSGGGSEDLSDTECIRGKAGVAGQDSGESRGPGELDDRYNEEGRERIEGEVGWWAVEPELGRLAHGVPYRVDRLRADGNGVVPLVAAYAYCYLKNAITV